LKSTELKNKNLSKSIQLFLSAPNRIERIPFYPGHF
jgi:hypothetical protein